MICEIVDVHALMVLRAEQHEIAQVLGERGRADRISARAVALSATMCAMNPNFPSSRPAIRSPMSSSLHRGIRSARQPWPKARPEFCVGFVSLP